MNSYILFIVGIVTIYHKSLMHIRSKWTRNKRAVNGAIFTGIHVCYKPGVRRGIGFTPNLVYFENTCIQHDSHLAHDVHEE